MINFRKEGLNHQKPQIWIGPKIPTKAWIYAWKHENKCKRKGIMVLPALGEENLAKNLVENDKKIDDWACLSWREIERKFWKLLKKLSWISQDLIKKKKKLIHNFRLIENQFQLIETDRGSLKIFKTILIDRKTDSINRNRQKLT